MEKHIIFHIPAEQNGLSVKTVLTSALSLSRHELSRLKFAENGILLNGEKTRVSTVLKEGDVLEVCFPAVSSELTESMFIPEILYKDEDLVIVNKPAGICSHPSHGHLTDDMGTALKAYLKDPSFVIRTAGRLDKDVSGLMIYALNQPSSARLARERSQGKLVKTYLAAAEGIFSVKKDTVVTSLAKDAGRRDRIVSEEGDTCITSYEVIAETDTLSILKIQIKTGRTHQIRAVMASLSHPLAGDTLYGGSTELIQRPALHCYSAELLQPFAETPISVKAPVPEDMKKLFPSGTDI